MPLATLGGTYSHSFAGDILEWISGYDDRPVYNLYLGDYDPTGVQIPEYLAVCCLKHSPHIFAADLGAKRGLGVMPHNDNTLAFALCAAKALPENLLGRAPPWRSVV